MNFRNALLIITALILPSSATLATVRYVDLNSASPESPYLSWSMAATNIQAAVDVSLDGDLILVTNGVYSTGGKLVPGDSTTSRVAVTRSVTVQSVNGPAATVIQGYQVPGTMNGASAVRCVYLTNSAVLSGFTVTGGATQIGTILRGGIFVTIYEETTNTTGGGVRCESTNAVVTNCVLAGNSAIFGAGIFSGTVNDCLLSNNIAQASGGGACVAGGSTVSHCLFTKNAAAQYGGGVFGSGAKNSSFNNFDNCLFTGNTANRGGAVAVLDGLVSLDNCTVSGNSASHSGGGLAALSGAAGSFLRASNCIVYGNTATNGFNFDDAAPGLFLRYCCTAPLPIYDIGDFTNDPAFINPGAGDFHLQSNSPCINAGNNATVSGTTDLDGNPRIVGGTVDLGAYECQTPALLAYYDWLPEYGLPTDASKIYADSDGDGMNNWQEWQAGTIPTDTASVLKMLAPVSTSQPSGLVVCWQSVNSRTYYLQRATDLGAPSPFSCIQSNIVGQGDVTSYMDTTATNGGPYFYRVGVQ